MVVSAQCGAENQVPVLGKSDGPREERHVFLTFEPPLPNPPLVFCCCFETRSCLDQIALDIRYHYTQLSLYFEEIFSSK